MAQEEVWGGGESPCGPKKDARAHPAVALLFGGPLKRSKKSTVMRHRAVFQKARGGLSLISMFL